MLRQSADDWIRCKYCGHKLMRVVDKSLARIETKCHSCKAINEIIIKTVEAR